MEPDRLTAEHLSRTEAATPASGASDATHLALTFENNRLASELFGQFDQNLALIEQKLKIDARARGNTVNLRGDEIATNRPAARWIISMTGCSRAPAWRAPTSKARSAWRLPPTTSSCCRRLSARAS
jgi:hypothetical protein